MGSWGFLWRLAVPVRLLAACGMVSAVTPTSDELFEAQRWVAAKFLETTKIDPPKARLVVVENNDSVQKCARAGGPLRIARQEFHHGLFCHARSPIMVYLPAPGATYTAAIGVDSNDQTRSLFATKA